MNSKKIREFVLSLGITPDLLGYRYIISAIELIIEENPKSVMKIYEQVAEIHDTTSSKVSRAMYHSIKIVLNSENSLEHLSNMFHCTFLSNKISNSKFLALCAETIRFYY